MSSKTLRRILLAGSLACLAAAPALADVALRLAYETRSVGEIDPCG